jgi:endonuclease/exonuclease/phosphatase family metal-dependent hydrolase
MRKFLKYCAVALLIPLAIFIILILYATLSDYRPAERELLKDAQNVTPAITDSAIINMVIWNIGYCGLDKEMDFFYDGGKGVRTSEDKLKHNFSNISTFLRANDSTAIIMLQEVDIKSHRSYRFNEVESITESMNDYKAFFGKNYDVFFVPLPFYDPMGSVNSGLLSLTRFNPSAVERYAFPGQYAWPKKLFMLDRCFLVMRFPVSNGKELLVINTHNEAYDNGSIRDQQMAYLKKFLLSEYQQGNYIVTGGDWNQCPPGFKPQFSEEIFDTINSKGIETDYLPADWKWVYNPAIPTNRRLDIAYSRGKTLTTVIDFFLLSPNIKPLTIKTTDLGFENSDHQPVSVKIALQKH